METKILTANQITEATLLLKNGELVAVPTETVYGLAADAKNNMAIRKIFTTKERPSDHPLIVHIDTWDKINNWTDTISESSYKLAKHFWPGPLTMIFRKKNDITNIITGGLDTVAIRIPNHSITLAIIKELENGIVAPSANAHKKTSPTNIEHVLKTLKGKIAAVIDGGECSIGIESTIIDMTSQIPTILRPGAITAEMIEDVLNIKIKSPFNHNEKVSGNMEIHYQPEKPLFLFTIAEILKELKKEGTIAVIHYSNLPQSKNAIYYKMSTNKNEYARNLYTTLHAIDKTNVEKILVEIPPFSNEWSGINDRLTKASWK